MTGLSRIQSSPLSSRTFVLCTENACPASFSRLAFHLGSNAAVPSASLLKVNPTVVSSITVSSLLPNIAAKSPACQ